MVDLGLFYPALSRFRLCDISLLLRVYLAWKEVMRYSLQSLADGPSDDVFKYKEAIWFKLYTQHFDYSGPAHTVHRHFHGHSHRLIRQVSLVCGYARSRRVFSCRLQVEMLGLA